jgi:hypothetical protein
MSDASLPSIIMSPSEQDELERYLATLRALHEVDGIGARLVGTYAASAIDGQITVAYSIGIRDLRDRYELRLAAQARGPPKSRAADLEDWLNVSVLPELRESILRATRHELFTPTQIKASDYHALAPDGPWRQVPGTTTFSTTVPKRRRRALSDALVSIVSYLPGKVDVYRLPIESSQ